MAALMERDSHSIDTKDVDSDLLSVWQDSNNTCISILVQSGSIALKLFIYTLYHRL